MTNIDYFQFSIDNINIDLDFTKTEGVVVIPLTNKEKNKLTEANSELIELITTYSKLKELKLCSKNHINEILKKIIDIIENTKYINYSSFCVYFRVLGFSYSAYMSNASHMNITEKINILKKIIDVYIKERHNIFLSHGYSNQILQVMSDASSSSRKGKVGINNILNLFQPYNFIKSNTFNQFEAEKKAYILPDKGDKNIMHEILKKYKIKFKFRNERENKNPDVIFKINKDIFICEHKLTNGSGGAQNAEINEIITFINQFEINSNIHYLSCLQGDFFLSLNGFSTQPKNEIQYNNIINFLDKYKQNYFVNENGLKKIIEDFVVLN